MRASTFSTGGVYWEDRLRSANDEEVVFDYVDDRSRRLETIFAAAPPALHYHAWRDRGNIPFNHGVVSHSEFLRRTEDGRAVYRLYVTPAPEPAAVLPPVIAPHDQQNQWRRAVWRLYGVDNVAPRTVARGIYTHA